MSNIDLTLLLCIHYLAGPLAQNTPLASAFPGLLFDCHVEALFMPPA